MADSRAKFQFYETFENIVALLPANEQLSFYKSIVRYGLFAEQPSFEGKDIAIFQPIKEAIDTQTTRKVKNALNGRLGGLAKAGNLKQTVATCSKTHEEKRKEEEEKENSDSDESSDLEKSQSLSNSSSKRFVKPTLEEIKAYCTERKNSVDAENFFNFYESKGWLVGKNKMKDWRASVRTWENKTQSNNNSVVMAEKIETWN